MHGVPQTARAMAPVLQPVLPGAAVYAASTAAWQPRRSPLAPPPLQMSLTAVMVTQFPIRLTVYAQQFEDVAANAVGSGGKGDGAS